MLALHQAQEVRASVMQYLRDTFHFQDSELEAAFEALMQHPKEGLFKGPYVSLKLPFVTAANADDSPLEISPNFPPYAHQLKAFERLHFDKKNRQQRPKPTIITTGTGSGKTESFVYPILDYCIKNKRSSGMKAIILYPMNALATDQANRIAEIIWKDKRLKDKVNVGLLIGLGQDKKAVYTRVMTKDKVIEDREHIIKYPPDILLTNFKMLDYALMQQDFQDLWFTNQARPEVLQYLVLDELHTYDGAQGTDVANLIRRLKLKLNLSQGSLCPVGTSATIGSTPDAKVKLAAYASKIFGEEITESAIIGEERQSPSEFFGSTTAVDDYLPATAAIYDSRLQAADDYTSYLAKQKALWQVNDLATDLKRLTLVQLILRQTSQGIISINDLIQVLKKEHPAYRGLAPKAGFDVHRSVILSLLALIAAAKVGNRPMLSLQVQVWLRELSNVLRTVQPKPRFMLAADYKAEEDDHQDEKIQPKGLPPYYCRECNHSGWIALYDEGRERLIDDVNKVYINYFGNNQNMFFVIPYDERTLSLMSDEYKYSKVLGPKWIAPDLTLYEKEVDHSFKVIGFQKTTGNYMLPVCPHCNAKDTIAILGTRAATLNSVATSQMLATNVSEASLGERKLLAFTNSVQDAAHHAGFVKARNYNFTFRTAVQQVVNLQESPTNLEELTKAFITYWQTKANEDNDAKAGDLLPYFIRFLPSDKKTKVDLSPDSQQWQTSKFLEEFNRRIAWNIFAEFGYNAIIGRTLEKTGSAGAFFKTDKFEEIYDHIKKWFATQTTNLNLPSQEQFNQFLTVFLHRMRIRGAIEHTYLNTYRTDKSSYYNLTESRNPQFFMMRSFGKRTRLPKLLTDQPFKKGGQSSFDVTKRESALNWFHAYFLKYFEWFSQEDKLLINHFYSELLSALEIHHILDKKASTGLRNFALSPLTVHIGKGAELLECQECGHRLHVHQLNSSIVTEAKCMSFRCAGHYQRSTRQSTSYYRQVYNRQNVPLITSFEHTGLLERKRREAVEKRFQATTGYDVYNVLIATSTLEMGIDIGNLDNTTNIGIPPLPSNFLQRIGRAGRKSGTATVLNIALNKPHDAFYFESPEEMMEGEVVPPGCYLSAKDILKRHFLAYCIDCWTVKDGSNRIPKSIRQLNISTLNIETSAFFVNDIIAFIEEHKEDLRTKFAKQYASDVSDAIFEGIWRLLDSGDWYKQLRYTFTEIKKRIALLYEKQKTTRAERNKLPKEDPDRKLLSNELTNIRGTINNLQKLQVLEHLTNVGLLPNYAFPETGVELSAVVRKKYDDTTEESQTEEFNIVRSAQSALRELIPENYFYTHGHKLRVQRIEIPNSEALESYRFCSNCDHIEKEHDFVNRSCPKCHDASWSQPLNKHTFLKQKLVTSYNDDQKSAIDDSKDERVELISKTSQHFDFNQGKTRGAWAMIEIPFGVEFVSEVTIRTVNLGIVEDKKSGDEIEINGKKANRRGFIICKHCQRSTSSLYKEDGKPKESQQYHFGYCPHRQVTYDGTNTDIFHEVFLYRSFQTEVLKILIPVYELESEIDMKLFKAGLELGLKYYFGGNPQHLRLADYEEKNELTGKIDRYLILYDTIPGGTGYLEELFHKQQKEKPFSKIIKAAYHQIKNCSCQDKGQDGCYRCIYTYKNQFNRQELSRKKAEALFEKIHLASENWQFIDNGLNSLSSDARLEESKLEELFIFYLKQRIESESNKDTFSQWDFQIKKDVTSKNKYQITTATGKTYEIRPQIDFDVADGILFPTRADFVIYSVDEATKEQFTPIAIYLDGHKYHASLESNIVFNDLQKRQHLNEKGYRTWTLSWNDVQRFGKKREDALFVKKILWKGEKEERILRDFSEGFLIAKNNMERLFWFLDNPEQDFSDIAKGYFYNFQQRLRGKSYQVLDFKKAQMSNLDLSDYALYKKMDAIVYLDTLQYTTHCTPFLGSLIKKKLGLSGLVLLQEENGAFPLESWEQFWQIYNLLQDTKMVEFEIKIREEVDTTEEEEDDDIFESFDKSVHHILKQLQENNISFSTEPPFSLLENNRVVASAELGLLDKKVVIDAYDELSIKRFKKAGYQVIDIEDFNINQL